MEEVIMKKGYTLEVTSWENDGDYYQTERVTYETFEQAKDVLKICSELFSLYHDEPKIGIGNMSDHEYDEAVKRVKEYFMKNPEVCRHFIPEDDLIEEDDFMDFCMDVNSSIMGSTEVYLSRVFESGKIFYVPEDIKVQVIETA